MNTYDPEDFMTWAIKNRHDAKKHYVELAAELAALRAELDELLTLVLHLAEKSPCARCVNGKDETGDACEFCGGYGFHPAGDIREHIIDAAAVLAKYAGKEE